MNTELTKEILNAIETNLPTIAASRLKDILTKAEENTVLLEELETKLASTQKYNTQLMEENQRLKDKVRSYEKTIDETNELKEELQKQLATLEVDKMKIQLDAANARVMVVENLVGKVFGHPQVTIGKSCSQSGPTGYISNTETICTTQSKV